MINMDDKREKKICEHIYNIINKIKSVKETENIYAIPVYGCSDASCKGFKIHKNNNAKFCEFCGKKIVRLNKEIEMLYYNQRYFYGLRMYFEKYRFIEKIALE